MEDLKGDLEVVVRYMDRGFMKTRQIDVKDAELAFVLKDLFVRLMKALVEMEKGNMHDKTMMSVFSDIQFDQI